MAVLKEDVAVKVRGIKLVIFDVDGVLTDGRIIYDDEGKETKSFDVKDGHAIKLLMRSGINAGIITARESKVVLHRAKNLGIDLVYQGRKDKLEAFEEIQRATGLVPSEIAYVGDDIIDLPVLLRAGFSAAVSDAVDEVKERVDYVANKPGGRGAVREVAEVILKTQGKWEEVLKSYLR